MGEKKEIETWYQAPKKPIIGNYSFLYIKTENAYGTFNQIFWTDVMP